VRLRKAVIETLSALALIGGLMAMWAVAASAQPLPGICGTDRTIGSVHVLVACPDWPSMRAVTGFAGFPDAKGQQVFVRSSDPAVIGFRISMTYRKNGEESTVIQFADVVPRMDSGVGWVLGEIEIVRVRVIELRDVAEAVVE